MNKCARKTGKIDISALYYPPEKHEYETARYFAKLGFDIIFIKPRNIIVEKLKNNLNTLFLI